jgi:type IV secretory pathway TraG/TraD family ATPase VirD4
MNDERISAFAESNHRGHKQRFGIKRKDRRYHMYVMGKTGMGKSTMLLNLIKQDLLTGEGLAVLDPHGDLAEKIIAMMPDSRLEDLIYLDATNTKNAVYFNPLEITDRNQAALTVSSLVSVFKKIWVDSWGPRMEYILRNSLSTLAEFKTASLLDLQRMLQDDKFRRRLVERIKSPEIKSFWLKEFAEYPVRMQAEALSPIQNKIGQFLNNNVIKKIVGRRQSSFNLRDVMDNRKVLIVNLSKGKIGEDSASLLGSMLITKLALAALSRQDMKEDNRKDFYLYADEFQSFATIGFIDILSEARKYRLNLILANQYLHQIDERIRRAIFGNIGTIITFRTGSEDAKVLAQEYYPVFNQSDLVNLPAYGIYLKLMIDGQTSKAFSADTLPLID